nr:hypothetical protein [Tanacetum cinerariifolium]
MEEMKNNNLERKMESLIPPSNEVNVDDTADKPLSRSSVQPVTQSKAPTDLKTKKNRILSSSKLESRYKVRVILLKKQVTKTQLAEVTVATTNVTKSLVSFELAEEQVYQPSTTEVKKVSKQQDHIMLDSKENTSIQEDSDSDLKSMLDDDLRSIFGFEADDSNDTLDHKVSQSDHISQDVNASSEHLRLPDHMDHIFPACEKKKIRRLEILEEDFVKENVVVDGMQRKLVPPPGGEIVGRIQGDEDQLSAKHHLAVKGHSECKASESNIRRIQFKEVLGRVRVSNTLIILLPFEEVQGELDHSLKNRESVP